MKEYNITNIPTSLFWKIHGYLLGVSRTCSTFGLNDQIHVVAVHAFYNRITFNSNSVSLVAMLRQEFVGYDMLDIELAY